MFATICQPVAAQSWRPLTAIVPVLGNEEESDVTYTWVTDNKGVIGTNQSKLRYWDIAKNKQLWCHEFSENVKCVDIRNGVVATLSKSGGITVLDCESGDVTRQMSAAELQRLFGTIHKISYDFLHALSDDVVVIFTDQGYPNAKLRITDIEDAQVLKSIPAMQYLVSSSLSSNSNFFLLSNADNLIVTGENSTWSLDELKTGGGELAIDQDLIGEAFFDENNNLLVYRLKRSWVQDEVVIQQKEQQPKKRFSICQNCRAIDVDFALAIAAVSNSDGDVWIYDFEGNRKDTIEHSLKRGPTELKFSHGGNMLLLGSSSSFQIFGLEQEQNQRQSKTKGAQLNN